MNCPNCKKDLVAGYDCVDCRDILSQPIVVEQAPVVVEEPKVEPVIAEPVVIKKKRGRPSKK